jgi:hypothetical protein
LLTTAVCYSQGPQPLLRWYMRYAAIAFRRGFNNS